MEIGPDGSMLLFPCTDMCVGTTGSELFVSFKGCIIIKQTIDIVNNKNIVLTAIVLFFNEYHLKILHVR